MNGELRWRTAVVPPVALLYALLCWLMFHTNSNKQHPKDEATEATTQRRLLSGGWGWRGISRCIIISVITIIIIVAITTRQWYQLKIMEAEGRVKERRCKDTQVRLTTLPCYPRFVVVVYFWVISVLLFILFRALYTHHVSPPENDLNAAKTYLRIKLSSVHDIHYTKNYSSREWN